MKLFKIITFITLVAFISGCTPKITVKSLYPSEIPNEKFHKVYVEEFLNDSLNQASKIENEILNKTIDNKRVFKITNINNAEVSINGEVLESTLHYDVFYKKDINYSRCRYYKYDEKTKKKTCIEYYERVIPCEDREYKVKTKIELLDLNDESLLFSKIYERRRDIQKCYDHHYYPYHSFHRDKRSINSSLASSIAKDFIDDISPHYVYFNLEIIDELDDSKIKYSSKQKEQFEKIVELIENKSITTANEKLKELNKELEEKSWEVLYNLALTYEAKKNLYHANKLYKKAKSKVSDIDDLELINKAINRTQKNLEEKIKALSQLPSQNK